MARKLSQSDPVLAVDFFISGFYTYRSQLYAPYKGIGVNVVSFHDPVIDGQNFELTDRFEWTRRPGFSIFCPTPLADREVINQFYFNRNLAGDVTDFFDSNFRLASFSSTGMSTILTKTTPNQGFIDTVGQVVYFADGVAADYFTWDGTNRKPWGLAAPTITPVSTGQGFWQPQTSFPLGTAILDPNGSIEVVTSILLPNGSFASPSVATTTALAGSLPLTWAYDPTLGGEFVAEGYKNIQAGSAFSGFSSFTAAVTFTNPVVMGNVIIVSFGQISQNVVPTVVSVTDNLGNVYSLQAAGSGVYSAGGGNTYPLNEWVYSAPVTVAGIPTITVQLSRASFQIIAREVQGIGATAVTNNFNYIVNGSTALPGAGYSFFSTGTVAFSGDKYVYSAILMDGPFAPLPPNGYPPLSVPAYTDGLLILGEAYLGDAYYGINSTASPVWFIPTADNLTLGLTVVFPITTISTGYTPYLFLSSFNSPTPLAIPAGAQITGIVVAIPKQNAGTGTVQDQSVRLVIGGVVVGNDYAHTTVWSNAGYAVDIYGGPIDTWGLTPTAAQLNAEGLSGFGVVIAAQITSTTGDSVVPEIGFASPNQATVTVYYKLANGLSGPGVSGETEPIWATSADLNTNDGGLGWTNYGPILTWQPVTGYPTPVVVLDVNGFLQLSTYLANPIPLWNGSDTYTLGEVVYWSGQYWISIFNGSNSGVPPSVSYATTGSSIITPYWALTTTPLVTGEIAPVWNTTIGGKTTDGSYTWTNIGQGTGLAFMGFAYVYAYRTYDGHLTTASPYSNNTGAILGPLHATITEFAITGASPNVITFTGVNNFIPGNVFEVQGLISPVGVTLNNQAFTVLDNPPPIPSASFPLTEVATDGPGTTATITALNNLVVGQTVIFTGVGVATFLNGVTGVVLSSGLSGTQFEVMIAAGHSSYGPAADSGTVNVQGSWSAAIVYSGSLIQLDAGTALPLNSTISGVGTGSPLCNASATITAVSITLSVVTITASNNFQPGIWVTLTGLTGATFLNDQQFQVIAVDQLIGTQNTYFQVYYPGVPNLYTQSPDTGTATFNAIEIYRTSDGGGTYLFAGAVTNPAPLMPVQPDVLGLGQPWTFNDFTSDVDLDVLLVAALNHQNDPPPGALGSTILTAGTILAYWQGRLWMAVGNYVYFDSGPDCTNGIPEQAWAPGNRFQFAGPVLSLLPLADGSALVVYLADRVHAILGGPETISFWPTDLFSNFGISNPNAIFKEGSIFGLFSTQRQYFELVEKTKNDIGDHVADYLSNNFDAALSYVTSHHDGLDVGVYISNGVDRILRYGTNRESWSVPYFPNFGAGACRSVETSVGNYNLLLASPTGGVTAAIGPLNPTSGTNVAIGTGPAWVNPSNITIGNPTDYATVTFTTSATSQVLRATGYDLSQIPSTAVVQGVLVTVVGKQSAMSSSPTVTITPTDAVAGAESHSFSFGTTNTTETFGGARDLWGMPWSTPGNLGANSCGCGGASKRALSFDITATGAPGGVGIQNILVQISAAQLKAAHTVPIVLIPAPGAGLVVHALNIIQQYNPGTVAYSTTPATIVGLGTAYADIINGYQLFVNEGSIFTSLVADFSMVPLTDAAPNTALVPNLAINQPLCWVNENDLSSDPGNSTVTLNIQYVIINPATGAIVGGTGDHIFGSMTVMNNATISAANGSGGTPVVLVSAPAANCVIVPLNQITISGYVTTQMSAINGPFTGLGATYNDAFNNNTFITNPFRSNTNTTEMDSPLSWNTGGVGIIPIQQPLLWATESVTVGDSFATVYVQYCIVNVVTGALVSAGPTGGDLGPGFATLSSAQIDAASATPQLIVAASVQAANTVQIPYASVAYSTFNGTPYSGGTGGTPNPVVGIGTTSAEITAWDLMTLETSPLLLTASTDQIYLTAMTAFDTKPLAQVENVPIQWADYNDLSGNTANSTAQVSVQYITVDMATGNILSGTAGSGVSEVDISEVQVTVTYQNPGNYIYARDLNSWGDSGIYGENNGTPYPFANIVVGSISLTQPGAPLIALQHVVGYFDAVGTLNHGHPSEPQIWILPNEVNDTQGIGFVYLPESVQEPPTGQTNPSTTLLQLRWPLNMMNSALASQLIHHIQIKVQFQPECAPNTIKALALKENQE